MSMVGRKVYIVIDIDSNDIQGVYSTKAGAEDSMADDGDDIEEWVVE